MDNDSDNNIALQTIRMSVKYVSICIYKFWGIWGSQVAPIKYLAHGSKFVIQHHWL